MLCQTDSKAIFISEFFLHIYSIYTVKQDLIINPAYSDSNA